MHTKILVKADELAREFAKILHRWLGVKKMREVVKRNKRYLEEGYLSVCASHDFCDANMAMLEAGHNLGMREDWALPCDVCEAAENGGDCPSCTAERELCNDAWGKAKADEFRTA